MTPSDSDTLPVLEYGITPDYGVEPVDTETVAPDTEPQMDYGLLPD